VSNLRSINAPGIYFRWRDGEVTTLLRSKDGEVGQDVQRRAYAVQKRMKRAAGYRSGALRRGIHVESVRESPIGPYSSIVSTAPHTMVHELGRGPVQPLIPIRGEYALKFQYKRGQKSMIRFEVKAAKGTHFMENSVDAALD
jgi:hypothetical protein